MAKNPPLREKHKRFCQEYIQDHNGAQAAIRAGYSPKSARVIASQLLANPNVQAYLASLHAKAESKAIMSAAEVLEEISLLGRTDMAHFVDVDETGAIQVKAFSAMPKGATRCIKKVREKRTIKQTPGDSPDMILESTLEFELWSKTDALDMMGRHHRIFDPKEVDPTKIAPVHITYVMAQPPEPKK